MHYTFHQWRARKPEATVWQELGWSMTEEDACRWAELTGNVIERVVRDGGDRTQAFGGAPAYLRAPETAVILRPRRFDRRQSGGITMALQTGTVAPEFTLASHTDQKVSLASFRGRRTVVSFLPFAFTGG